LELSGLCKLNLDIDEIAGKTRDTSNWGREMAQVHFHLEESFPAMEEMFGSNDFDLLKLREELTRLSILSKDKEPSLLNKKTSKVVNPEESSSEFPSNDTPGSKSLTGSLTNGYLVEENNFNSSETDDFLSSSISFNFMNSLPNTPIKNQEPRLSLAERFEKNSSSSIAPLTSIPRVINPSASPPLSRTPDFPTNPECPGCKKPFTSKESKFTHAMKHRWHPECFLCGNCKKTINAQFMMKGAGPLCYGCTLQLKECRKCGNELNAQYRKVTVQNSNQLFGFHQECWKCDGCGNGLGEDKSGIRMSLSLENGIRFLCSACNVSRTD